MRNLALIIEGFFLVIFVYALAVIHWIAMRFPEFMSYLTFRLCIEAKTDNQKRGSEWLRTKALPFLMIPPQTIAKGSNFLSARLKVIMAVLAD